MAAAAIFCHAAPVFLAEPWRSARTSRPVEKASRCVRVGKQRISKISQRGPIRCEAQRSEQAKEELEEIAHKVSVKADEISKDFAKTTEDLKQAAPPVLPEVEKSFAPEKVPSGPYSFQEVFSFAGLAPEITNGRIAMLSYLSVITLEYVTGKGIVEQLSTGGWVPAVVISSLIGIGSVVPLFKGYTNDDWPGIGPFTAKAERWNSRAAMVAFALLVTVELVKGGPEIVQGGPIGF